MNEFARVGFNYGSFYYAYILRWQLLEQNIKANWSKIKLQSIIYVGANNINWSSGSAILHGTSFSLSSSYGRGETVVYEKEVTINHDANGKASVYISGSINTKFLMNGNCGGTINLPDIDRKAPSVSIAIEDIKEKSVFFSYSSNSSFDSVQVRLNNGNWFSITASPVVINNLTEDSNYTLQVRVKKTSNQVWGESRIISFKTLETTFAFISNNRSKFIPAEVYIITKSSINKLSKEQYKSIVRRVD